MMLDPATLSSLLNEQAATKRNAVLGRARQAGFLEDFVSEHLGAGERLVYGVPSRLELRSGVASVYSASGEYTECSLRDMKLPTWNEPGSFPFQVYGGRSGLVSFDGAVVAVQKADLRVGMAGRVVGVGTSWARPVDEEESVSDALLVYGSGAVRGEKKWRRACNRVDSRLSSAGHWLGLVSASVLGGLAFSEQLGNPFSGTLMCLGVLAGSYTYIRDHVPSLENRYRQAVGPVLISSADAIRPENLVPRPLSAS